MKKLFFGTIFALIFLCIGGWAGTLFSTKSTSLLALCTMTKTAVAKNYLTQAQVYKLAEDTGAEFKKTAEFISEKMLVLNKEVLANASEHSDCSQTFVHLAKGYQK